MFNFKFKEATPIERASVITREEAVEVLTQLINSGILTYDIEEKLVDISNLIDLERVGYHLWGADEQEYTKLNTAFSNDVVTPALEEELETIDDKYSFIPSHFEHKEIEANINDYDEEE